LLSNFDYGSKTRYAHFTFNRYFTLKKDTCPQKIMWKIHQELSKNQTKWQARLKMGEKCLMKLRSNFLKCKEIAPQFRLSVTEKRKRVLFNLKTSHFATNLFY